MLSCKGSKDHNIKRSSCIESNCVTVKQRATSLEGREVIATLLIVRSERKVGWREDFKEVTGV